MRRVVFIHYVFVLFVAAAGLLALGAEARKTARPFSAKVTGAFSYPGNKAARAAWEPMKGTAEVQAAKVSGRSCLKMVCNFAGTRIERASWDLSVRWDLVDCRGVRFRMYMEDSAPVDHFSMYFHSGSGWYAASFGPHAHGRWHTVTVEKHNTRIEGKPGGWGKVDTLRISAWRGSDRNTEFYLSNMETFGRPAALAVVRADSVIRAGSGEARAIRGYTNRMAAMLRTAGLRPAVFSDLHLTAGRLKNKKLVVLPHNTSLPGEASAGLVRWLERGGRVMVFYTMPRPLQKATGITSGKIIRRKEPGDFAGIRFKESSPEGMPDEVQQASWNVRQVKTTGHGAEVVANWFDQKGNDTGRPAVVISERCVFMTHVLLGDGKEAKQSMLLSMAGYLVPEFWRRAARGKLDQAGKIGPYESFQEAASGIREGSGGRKKPLEALERAGLRLRAARRLMAQSKFPEALKTAGKARALLVRARCLAQSAPEEEHRGMWCHSAFGPTEETWDDEIRAMAENGFTALLVNMCWGDTAYYKSDVLPVAPEVAEKGDQVAECLKACLKHGVECHIWKVNWRMRGRSSQEFRERIEREGRLQVGFDGEVNTRWLCPSHPANRQLEIDSMVELAVKYRVHGIHFDYIRYPNRNHCFCPGCRKRFEKAIGRKVADWPEDVREKGDLHEKWLQFRRNRITSVVEEVHRKVKKARPKCEISAAVFRHWPAHRDTVGQDWKSWCERGLLDFVCPMDYTPSNGRFKLEVENQRAWAAGVPYYPGIGLSTWPDPTDINRLIDQIRITREAGTGGFTIFQYGEAQKDSVLPLCGLGITRKR